MCDPATVVGIVGIGASLLGSKKQSDAIDDASEASLAATREQIQFGRESRDLALLLSDPQRVAGWTAMAAMMDMMGLPRGYASQGPLGVQTGPNDYGAGGGGLTPAGAGIVGRIPGWPGVADYGQSPYPDGSSAWLAPLLANYGQTGVGPYTVGNPYAEAAMEPGGVNFADKIKAGMWEKENGSYGNAREGFRAEGSVPPGVSYPDLGQYPKYEWQADPSYAWRYNEGIRAMDASSSAKGLGLSGGYGKALQRYGQDMASQEYMNIYNRLAVMAGYAPTGVAEGTQAAGNFGNLAANAMGGYGATRASAYVAQGNTMAGMYGDLASIFGNLPWGSWFGKKPTAPPGYYEPGKTPGV